MCFWSGRSGVVPTAWPCRHEGAQIPHAQHLSGSLRVPGEGCCSFAWGFGVRRRTCASLNSRCSFSRRAFSSSASLRTCLLVADMPSGATTTVAVGLPGASWRCQLQRLAVTFFLCVGVCCVGRLKELPHLRYLIPPAPPPPPAPSSFLTTDDLARSVVGSRHLFSPARQLALSLH